MLLSLSRGEDNATILELNKNLDLVKVIGQDELVTGILLTIFLN